MILKREAWGGNGYHFIDNEPVSEIVWKKVWEMQQELMKARSTIVALQEKLNPDPYEYEYD